MILLNGQPAQAIDIADRGLHYGDGAFETIEILGGQPLFLDRHLARLQSACDRLLIPPPDRNLLADEARQVSAGAESAVLKLMVTRGCGGRGYRQPPSIVPTRLLIRYPFPVYPPHFQSDGVILRFCRMALSSNPALAGIKHMNRLEQVLARAEWQDEAIQEGLMMDSHGSVIEGTMSNLFMVKDGCLHTPALDQCGIAGIMRGIVMECAGLRQIPLIETRIDKQSLLLADELFVTNSIIGIWPVKQIEQTGFQAGGVTRSLQQMLTARRTRGGNG